MGQCWPGTLGVSSVFVDYKGHLSVVGQSPAHSHSGRMTEGFVAVDKNKITIQHTHEPVTIISKIYENARTPKFERLNDPYK